jgi:hypothetical protein
VTKYSSITYYANTGVKKDFVLTSNAAPHHLPTMVFWVVTLCGPVGINQRFGRT